MTHMEIIKHAGHESSKHLLLKKAAKLELSSQGFQVSLESNVSAGCRVDVLGIHVEKNPIVIECETLFDLQRKLLNTLQKAYIRYGQVKAILCIPELVPFAEIWCIKDTGEIGKYKKEVK